MNWDAMAAIAEIVASFGVIVSLIYLATQIRYQRSDYLRGMTEYNSLDRVERLRFSGFFSRLMRIFDSMYSRHRQNALDPTLWPSYEESMRDFFSHAGLRDWWVSRSHWFTPELRELVSEWIAEERNSTMYDQNH